MPLETGTFISDFVTANPAHSDSVGQADSHVRFIKSCLLNTFTAISGAVTATHTQLNAAAAAVVAGTTPAIHALGTALLPSMTFLGNLNTGVFSPAANKVGIATNGLLAALFGSDQSLTLTGAYLGGTGQLGVIGEPRVWLSNTLPSGNFAWLNGQAINRVANPTLFTMWGTTYGAGDGSTTFNIPNWQGVVPIGRATMGGAADPGLVTNAGISTLGTILGEGKHAQLQTELPAFKPAITITDPTHPHGVSGGTLGGTSSQACWVGGGSFSGQSCVTIPTTIVVNNASTGVTAALTSNLGSGTAFNVVQPSAVCNWMVLLG